MIKNECKHEWEKHTNVRADRRPATYICKMGCNSEMTASEVFQLEGLKEQSKRHKEILESQNTYNTKQLHWTKVLAIAAIATSLISVYAFYKSSILAEYRPYVGIEKIEIVEENNRLNAKVIIVNTSSIPANNFRVIFKQFIDGEPIVAVDSNQFQSSFLMPFPNRVTYKFWGDKKVIEEGHEWTIQFTFNYDGVSSKDHETQFSGRYNSEFNAFNVYQGYAD